MEPQVDQEFGFVRVLIADEDIEMRDLIGGQITTEYGNRLLVDSAANGKSVLKQITETHYDLLIVNWALPEVSKVELMTEIRKVRTASALAVLVILSSADPELISLVLESGASESLSKPFERTHLMRKVKMFLKKNAPHSTDQVTWGSLILDTRTFDLYCGADRIHLTPSEFKLLRALIGHRGAVMSRDQLIELVQGEGIAVIDRAVDTHIFSLRKKLGQFSEMVETVRGSGYRIKAL